MTHRRGVAPAEGQPPRAARAERSPSERGRVLRRRSVPRRHGLAWLDWTRLMRPTFINVGERTNVTGSAKFRKLVVEGDYPAALAVARQQVEAGRPGHRRQHGRGPAGFGVVAMRTFLNLIAAEPDIARVPVMIDCSKWEVIEAGLKCVQGKAIVNSISHEGGRGQVPRAGREMPALRRGRGGHGLRRGWARPTPPTARSRSAPAPTACWSDEVGFPPEDIIFDPNIFAVATGIEEHDNYAVDFIEATRRDQGRPCRTPGSRAGSPTSRSASAATSRCAGRSTAVFLYHAIARGHGHGHRQRRRPAGL